MQAYKLKEDERKSGVESKEGDEEVEGGGSAKKIN